jgi:nicotinamidase-related amidase
MATRGIMEQSIEFLGFLDEWLLAINKVPLDDVINEPAHTAILSVDVINGFCVSGPLYSPRVSKITAPIADLFTRSWDRGVRHIVLTQDTHEPDALEFGQFPAHCVRGSAEAEPVEAFKALPFFDRLIQIPKNSIHSGLNTGLNDWVAMHAEIDTFIVVGDCTDLCMYQLAMHLRLEANARHLQRRVILPVDCVDTYDRPVSAARDEGGLPHPGDLLHAIFLYHMALNGVEVFAKLI